MLNKNFGEIARLGLAAENGMYFSWDSSNASKTRLERNFNEEPDDDNQANQLLAKNLKGKLMLAHGNLDDNVPPYSTLLVVDALIKENKDHAFQVLYYFA